MPSSRSFAAAASPFRITRPENDSDAFLAELARGLQAETAIAASNECNFSFVLYYSFVLFIFVSLNQRFKIELLHQRKIPPPQWSVILPSERASRRRSQNDAVSWTDAREALRASVIGLALSPGRHRRDCQWIFA
ncbi:MAG: hypothetical protein Udaeo2_11790 [Candidatus Udaeobacter sp.]|nr:MAG: hypothetical protein Udaeo2_11790 [Candidatus Udaeobacter sp.]